MKSNNLLPILTLSSLIRPNIILILKNTESQKSIMLHAPFLTIRDNIDSFSLAIANNHLFEKKDKFSNNSKESFLSHSRLSEDPDNSQFAGLLLPPTLACEFCTQPLVSPVKLACGHVFCEKCGLLAFQKDLKKWLEFETELKAKAREEEGPEGRQIGEHRDLDKKFFEARLKEDSEKERDLLEKRKTAVQKGECISCGDKINGIFNDVQKVLDFLERAKKRKAEDSSLISKRNLRISY